MNALLQYLRTDVAKIKKTAMHSKIKNRIKNALQYLEQNKEREPLGYKYYPADEDIYKMEKEEADLDPEDPAKVKTRNENAHTLNEKDFDDDLSGDDLDVPGSELDDNMEKIGSEDEENNYYSLGNDNDPEGMEMEKDQKD